MERGNREVVEELIRAGASVDCQDEVSGREEGKSLHCDWTLTNKVLVHTYTQFSLTYPHTHTSTCTHTQSRTHTYTYTHMHKHTHTHTHPHTHSHTHTHTHTHTLGRTHGPDACSQNWQCGDGPDNTCRRGNH